MTRKGRKDQIKTVSVVMPAMNEMDNLPVLRDALDMQTIQPLEVIVAVSPRSTDGTADLARSYDWRVTRGGLPAAGRNEGAKLADGDLLFFLDADCRPESRHFIENAIREFNQRGYDAAATTLEPDPWSLVHFIGYGVVNTAIRVLQYFWPGAQQGMLMRGEVFKDLDGFDNDIFAEDSQLMIDAQKAGYKFRILRTTGPIYVTIRRSSNKEGIMHALKMVKMNIARIFGKRVPIDCYFGNRPFSLTKTLLSKE